MQSKIYIEMSSPAKIGFWYELSQQMEIQALKTKKLYRTAYCTLNKTKGFYLQAKISWAEIYLKCKFELVKRLNTLWQP